MKTPRTIIEFIEPIADPKGALCHKAKEVRVNGIPVLVKDGGIEITFGADELTTVTLELLATEIHFRAAEPFETEQSKDGGLCGSDNGKVGTTYGPSSKCTLKRGHSEWHIDDKGLPFGPFKNLDEEPQS